MKKSFMPFHMPTLATALSTSSVKRAYRGMYLYISHRIGSEPQTSVLILFTLFMHKNAYILLVAQLF